MRRTELVTVVALQTLMLNDPMNVRSDEVDAIRRLECAVDPGTVGYDYTDRTVQAPAVDAQRWLAATRVFRTTIGAVAEQKAASNRLLPPSWPGMRRRWWYMRRFGRIRRTRARYDEIQERLRGETVAAYRRYREEAGDLSAYIVAETERRKREEHARQERARETRAAAMAAAAVEPVWGYRLDRLDEVSDHRWMQINLVPIEPDLHVERLDRTGLVLREITSAIAAERARDPYVAVTWSFEAEQALREWHGSDDEIEAWREFTGVSIDSFPLRPGYVEWTRSQRGYGPSSNYFSPGGFGI